MTTADNNTCTEADPLLTVDTLPAYLEPYLSKELAGTFDKNAHLKAAIIVGGNVNYAFCVSSTVLVLRVNLPRILFAPYSSSRPPNLSPFLDRTAFR
mgnify:CR=1 FL=1